MQESSRKIQWLVWGGLVLVIASIVAAFVVSKNKGPKPSSLGVLRQVTPFSLTNQVGQTVSDADLRGQVWLADIIFTRCGGPCLRMTKQISELQAALPQEIKFVSLTADPEYDTVEVLKKYGEKFNADPKRWMFLTGQKEPIYKLAVEGLLLSVEENTTGDLKSIDDMFIHSTLFVLVDRKGNVRSFYESAEPTSREKILGDVQQLLQE